MEDEVSALESVLAFIEAYDVGSIDALDGSQLSVDDVEPSVRLGVASGAKETPAKRRKRTSTRDDRSGDADTTTSYTTMLQRRKRAEVQTLREQVQELQAHLLRLQRARWGSQSGSKKSAPTRSPPSPSIRLAPSMAPGGIRLQDLWESAVGDAPEAQVKVPRPFGSGMAVQDGSQWLDSAVQQYRLRRRSELKNRQLKQLMSQQMNLNTSILRLMQKRALCPVRDLQLVSKRLCWYGRGA